MKHPRTAIGVAAAVATAAIAMTVGSATQQASAGSPAPGAPGCPMFPADNVWNTDISSLPVDTHSETWKSKMGGTGAHIWPDMGSSGNPAQPYGIPYSVVHSSHAFSAMSFMYQSESDPGPYPTPGSDIPLEHNSDAHQIVVNADTCKLYEEWQVTSTSHAGSGAIFDLNSNALRPDTWTSADAAGLPMLPGLLRKDEIDSGSISHALRFTAAASAIRAAHIWPARHDAGGNPDPNAAPFGARFRLSANFDITRYRPDTQVVLLAMQHYGMILADIGANWFFQGEAINTWDQQMLDELKAIPANEFEAVDESSLMVSPDSAQAKAAPIVPPAPVTGPGYLLADRDGRVYSFGGVHAGSYRPLTNTVDIEMTPSGNGYWTLASDGTVLAMGDAGFFGQSPARQAGERIVSISRTATGQGYWLFSSKGRAFPYGDAVFHGDMSGTALNGPVLDSIPTPSGQGYYMVASDGGVFTFGDAHFAGSMGDRRLNQPVRSLVPDPDGAGYWLVAGDGGIFSFEALFHGSMGDKTLNKPVVGMVASGTGYLMVAADGGVFNFGNPFYGSLGDHPIPAPIVSVAAHG